MYRRAFRIGGLVLADVAILRATWPDVRDAAAGVAGPHAWTARAGADAALASLAAAILWLVAAWLALGLLAAAGAGLPGALGRLTAAASRVLLPGAVLRLVAGTAGLTVLLTPVAATAAPSAAPHRVPAAAGALPAPTWPTTPARDRTPRQAPAPTAPSVATPPPLWPTGNAVGGPAGRAIGRNAGETPGRNPGNPNRGNAGETPGRNPGNPNRGNAGETPGRGTGAATGSNPGNANGSGPGAARGSNTCGVRVRPGDSLWLIAARRIGPGASDAQVADSWPQWYAANRKVIGVDPDVILPGQQLIPPGGRR
jgi:hypothetical protein